MERIASLAGLDLEREEILFFAPTMKRVLEAFAILQAVDTSAVEREPSLLEIRTPMRPDEPLPSMPRRKIMDGRGRRNKGFYTVPKVIP